MTVFDDIIARTPKAKSDGDWTVGFCPAHEANGNAHKPSFRFRRADVDDGALVCCMAGCSAENLHAAFGFGADVRTKATKDSNAFLLYRHSQNCDGKRRLVATYDYADEAGALLFQVCRYEPKDFRQRRPDGNGGWVWRLDATRRVLYGLPAILETVAEGTGAIAICEGEKDVHALKQLGVVGTCNPGGAGKWRDAYSEQLKGARLVVILPDNDDAGRDHARQVADSLARAGVPDAVVELPGVPEKGDVSDWVAAGGTKEELLKLVETIMAEVSDRAVATDEGASSETKQASDHEEDVLHPDHHYTDTGNAARLIDYCGERVRYCAILKSWHIYDGTRWAADDTLRIEDLAGEALRGIYDEAAAASDRAIRERLSNHAVASEAANRRCAAVKLARSDRHVAVRASEFDRCPWELNCLSGTIDLRNGKLGPHDAGRNPFVGPLLMLVPESPPV